MSSSSTQQTGTILDRILETKREEVAALKAGRGLFKDLLARCAELPPTRGFKQALRPPSPTLPPQMGGGRTDAEAAEKSRSSASPLPPSDGGRGRGKGASIPALIAEVKKASPSKGVIREDFEPMAIARAYHAGGASCLSVLTDRTYFQGDLSYLSAIREAVPLPLLRKDFLIDPLQVIEAREAGADAILLIVATIPSPARLAEMRHVAELVGMDALVEVHDAAELEMAKESGATLIGINNRDLRTFAVRLETTLELLPHFPPDAVAVAESGIFTGEDVRRLGDAGADAILVGESLMRADDIEAATRALLSNP